VTQCEGHGRSERREHFICPVPANLPDRERWPKLTAIAMVVTNVIRNGVETSECRRYILSKYLTATKFAEAIRDHWSIENCSHWQLDVTFQEDQCRIRKGNADANFSSLRRTALSLLKNNRTKKVGVKNKRLIAGWSDRYRLEVLFGQ
jgi:predicted transposase YbfD/YdcC